MKEIIKHKIIQYLLNGVTYLEISQRLNLNIEKIKEIEKKYIKKQLK